MKTRSPLAIASMLPFLGCMSMPPPQSILQGIQCGMKNMSPAGISACSIPVILASIDDELRAQKEPPLSPNEKTEIITELTRCKNMHRQGPCPDAEIKMAHLRPHLDPEKTFGHPLPLPDGGDGPKTILPLNLATGPVAVLRLQGGRLNELLLVEEDGYAIQARERQPGAALVWRHGQLNARTIEWQEEAPSAGWEDRVQGLDLFVDDRDRGKWFTSGLPFGLVFHCLNPVHQGETRCRETIENSSAMRRIVALQEKR